MQLQTIIQSLTTLQTDLKTSIAMQQQNIDKLVNSLPTLFESFLDQKLQTMKDDIALLQKQAQDMQNIITSQQSNEMNAPGSGNPRNRKHSRPTPADLSAVNRKLITKFLQPQSQESESHE